MTTPSDGRGRGKHPASRSGRPAPASRILSGNWYLAALRSQSLRAASLFAISGAAFAVGNLLLARRLAVTEFGSLVLAVAIYMVLAQVAPLGTDQLLVRRSLAYNWKTALLQAVAGLLIGGAAGMGVYELAGFPWLAAAGLGCAIMAGSLLVGVSAEMRSRDLALAPLVYAAPNFVLLLIGCAVQFMAAPPFELVLATFAAALLLLTGPAVLLARRSALAAAAADVKWLEAVPILGLVSVAVISGQFERLLLPLLLGLDEVATFGVLSSLAIFPFRLLDAGVNFTLTPRLSAAKDPEVAYRAFKGEVGMVAAVLVLACLAIILLAPAVASGLTGGRYELPVLLVICACLTGLAKLMHGLLRSLAVALGSPRELHQANACGWIALTAAAIGAVLGSQYGLIGFVGGSALGYGLLMAPVLSVAVLRLRARSRAA